MMATGEGIRERILAQDERKKGRSGLTSSVRCFSSSLVQIVLD
jgi:hypothetical protein